MSSIVFKNKGLIDIKAITTFGISSKENESAIGYFGTGLKYAIAILLREGCEITIFSGEDIYEFKTVTKQVRVNEFNFIQMNGVDLAFTTELGKNWELWQAYRELYCNCKDEYGTITKENNTYSFNLDKVKDSTIIVVRGSKFESIFDNDSSIVLKSKPIEIVSGVEIHHGISKYLYYKGIRVMELPKKSYYTYNILFDVKLTEDRTVADYWATRYNLLGKLVKLTTQSIIDTIIKPIRGFLEYDFDFDMNGYSYSAEFLKLATQAVKHREIGTSLSLTKYIKSTTNVELDMYEDLKLNKIQQIALDKAISFLKDINYPVDDYKIRVVKDLGTGYVGLAKDETIFLSEQLFLMGTKQIASCLLEEYIHLKLRLRDETRELQTYLLDTIISLGELLTDKSL